MSERKIENKLYLDHLCEVYSLSRDLSDLFEPPKTKIAIPIPKILLVEDKNVPFDIFCRGYSFETSNLILDKNAHFYLKMEGDKREIILSNLNLGDLDAINYLLHISEKEQDLKLVFGKEYSRKVQRAREIFKNFDTIERGIGIGSEYK